MEIEEFDDFAETVSLDSFENEFVHDLGPEIIAVSEHVVESFFEDFEICCVGCSVVNLKRC